MELFIIHLDVLNGHDCLDQLTAQVLLMSCAP